MPTHLVTRTAADVEALRNNGDHTDSWRAAWEAIRAGSGVIRDIQEAARTQRGWRTLHDASPLVNDEARTIMEMRLQAIHQFKRAPHHARGFRMSERTGTPYPRTVNALCLISGHEGQEIPGLVDYDRVVVDAEHME